MSTVNVSAPRIDALSAESHGMEMRSYLCAVALALADQKLRQRMQLIIQAYDRLVTGSKADEEPEPPHEPVNRPMFAGGRVFSFGPFRLVPSRRLLLEGNRKVQIGSRAFDILTVLVERAGDVVGKDELIAKVWPNVFVEDCNLKTQVSTLRRALGEDHAGRCYIVTIPGRGYNFIAPVSLSASPLSDGPGRRQAWAPDPLYSEAQRHDVFIDRRRRGVPGQHLQHDQIGRVPGRL